MIPSPAALVDRLVEAAFALFAFGESLVQLILPTE